jgi:F0F1-type ATP synthase assembly protein I
MRNIGVWQAVAIASQVGFVMAAAVAIGLLAGWYLDSIMHTSPIFTALGAFTGLAGGIFSCVQLVRDFQRNGQPRE